MKVHVAFGYGLFTGGLGNHYGAERLGCAVIPVSGGMTERQVQLIRDFKPEIVMATPSYMLAILDEFRRAKASIRAHAASSSACSAPSRGPTPCAPRSNRASTSRHRPLRALGGDRPRRVLRMRRDEGRPAHLGGPLLSRGRRSRYRRRPAGWRTGRTLLTSLTKEAMPIIRYRTRDLPGSCPARRGRCGGRRGSPARTDDMIILRGVNVFPSLIEEQIASAEGCRRISSSNSPTTSGWTP